MTNKTSKNYFQITLFSFFLTSTIITAYSKFFFQDSPTIPPSDIKEVYDPSLNYIQSIEELDIAVKQKMNNKLSDTSRVVNTIDDLLRARFYHSFSAYTFRSNWIAYLCSKIFWNKFRYIVIEDDILKFPMAGCSQQGLVFQKMLARYGINYASTLFLPSETSPGGHYTVNVYYNNQWHFFDSNLEPNKLSGNPSIEELMLDTTCPPIYKEKVQKWAQTKAYSNMITIVNVNTRSGWRMYIFQSVTNFLSSWLWLMILSLQGIVCSSQYIKQSRSKNREVLIENRKAVPADAFEKTIREV